MSSKIAECTTLHVVLLNTALIGYFAGSSKVLRWFATGFGGICESFAGEFLAGMTYLGVLARLQQYILNDNRQTNTEEGPQGYKNVLIGNQFPSYIIQFN